MSGGSHNFAFTKVEFMASDFGDIYNEEFDPDGSYSSEDHELRQHPLRVRLARFMIEELSPVLKAIEWSDSGDTAEDHWVEITEAFLGRHSIGYDN